PLHGRPRAAGHPRRGAAQRDVRAAVQQGHHQVRHRRGRGAEQGQPDPRPRAEARQAAQGTLGLSAVPFNGNLFPGPSVEARMKLGASRRVLAFAASALVLCLLAACAQKAASGSGSSSGPATGVTIEKTYTLLNASPFKMSAGSDTANQLYDDLKALQ